MDENDRIARSSLPAPSSAHSTPPHRRTRSGTSSIDSSRASTPSTASTPSSKRATYSDRFIPMRNSDPRGGLDLRSAFDLLHTSPINDSPTHTEDVAARTYSLLLKSELFGRAAAVPHPTPAATSSAAASTNVTTSPHHNHNPGTAPSSYDTADTPVDMNASFGSDSVLDGLDSSASSTTSSAPPVSAPPPPNVFRFERNDFPSASSARVSDNPSLTPHSTPPYRSNLVPSTPYTLSPVGADAAQVLQDMGLGGGRRVSRKIAKAPFKVLDAPHLQDDFYLNLMDWSSQNVIAVGLGSNVYLWSACTSTVTKLVDLGVAGPVCSVGWSQAGKLLAVGTSSGQVQLYDTATCKRIRTLSGHTARVGCLAWNSTVLSSGSRDRAILHRDLRAPDDYVAELKAHRQEVCGLKWSDDEMQLASGGNDNKLLVWSAAAPTAPAMRFCDHEAAVKAIAWSPHQRGLLASGGGTADRTIRFWNTITQASLQVVDTGSQVCNLAWSKNVNEVVSTHGYSQNQIVVWRYPSLSKLVTLTGHSYRVLFLAVSPSGENIVTGAGDETLRFWNVFPGPRTTDRAGDNSSALSQRAMNIR